MQTHFLVYSKILGIDSQKNWRYKKWCKYDDKVRKVWARHAKGSCIIKQQPGCAEAAAVEAKLQKLLRRPFPSLPLGTTSTNHAQNTHDKHTKVMCSFFHKQTCLNGWRMLWHREKVKKRGKNCVFFEDCFTCDIFEASVAAADRHGGGFDQTPEATHPIQSLLDHQTSVVRPRIPRGRTQRWVWRSRLGRGRGSRRVIAFHHFFSPNTFFYEWVR